MRRLVDVVVSILVGLVLVPVAAAVALALWCQSGSPVLFRQERAGRYGEPFTILKFRTMTPLLFPGQSDRERLTPLGRFLRATSLDEIPQLGNVLRGEMSLIGPRPTLPEQVVHYTARQRRRLIVLPGLTGWAQVRGRNSLSWPERIELDIWYVARRSLPLDLKIFCLTLLRLIRPTGITGAAGENPGFPHPLPRPVDAESKTLDENRGHRWGRIHRCQPVPTAPPPRRHRGRGCRRPQYRPAATTSTESTSTCAWPRSSTRTRCASACEGASSIVHLAAVASVPRSVADPRRTHDANVTGTLAVLDVARAVAAHVVVASSSSVYGHNPALPKTEDMLCLPASPYAVSKLAAESYALAYRSCYAMECTAFRFFNVYGPWQPPDHVYAAVVPAFVAAALRGEPLIVHGDGEQSRDFTFVDSVTEVLARTACTGSPSSDR